MLKKFQRYIENEPWEHHLDEDSSALVIFSWVAIIFSIVWFGPTILQIMIWGPVK